MMKKIILIALCCLPLSSAVNSQEIRQTELQSLNRQIPALLERDNFDEVVSVAEKIVQIEKQGGAPNLPNYAAAVMNLALWKKQRLARKPQVVIFKTFSESFKVLLKESEEIEDLFRELLLLFENNLNDPKRLAAVQGELARLLFTSYLVPEKIAEAGKLYEQSLALREKHLGEDADATLSTMFQLSDFYFQTGDFEKFLPLYQKLTSATEKKYGENNKRLIPAWRLFSGFLITTDRLPEAAELLKKVSTITGQEEALPAASYKLFNRAASKLDTTIGAPTVFYTSSSPIVMPNPTDVVRNRPTRLGTYDRPQTTSGKIVNGALEIPAAISGGKDVLVNILIDEGGNVVEANPQTEHEKVKKEVAKKVLKWKFKPFVDEGGGRRMRGVVNVTYYKPIPVKRKQVSKDKSKKDK